MASYYAQLIPVLPFHSGYTYAPTNASGTGVLTNNQMRAMPFYVAYTTTFDRIGAEVTGAGEAGSKVRLGIYQDDGTGIPGTLLLDAGQIDGTSVTYQTITIAQTLTPGIYWLANACQSAPTTPATMRQCSAVPFPSSMGWTGSPSSTTLISYSSGTSVTAGLPATFGTIGTQGAACRVVLRAA